MICLYRRPRAWHYLVPVFLFNRYMAILKLNGRPAGKSASYKLARQLAQLIFKTRKPKLLEL